MDFHNKVIPYFPTGRPDELLYSICATFQDHMQFPKPHYVMETLFGYKWAHATYDLPNRLEYLVNNLPPGCNYTVDKLIDNHTMLPLYSPFCPQERIHRVREAMHQSGRGNVHSLLGILYTQRLKFLRFCPLCVKEDAVLFDEPYWHRVHQVIWVHVCPIHAVSLETSRVPIQQPSQPSVFVPAREGSYECTPNYLDLNDQDHNILLKVSRDAAWLLTQGSVISDPESIHRRYKILLKSKDLVTYRGTVSRRKELINQFLCFYPSNILENFNCQLSASDDYPWLIYLPQDRTQKLQPVIHHLLFIQFLGHTAEKFFRLSHEFQPFGAGPWPCLNPVCKNFQQMCVEEYSLSYSIQPGRRPIGTFQCICCSFNYSRLGPDVDYEARFNYSRVNSYGVVWEAALKAFWEDPNVTVHEMARRLGVHDKTVKRQAARLNLPLPREAIWPISVGAEVTRRRNKPPKANRLQLYRNEWLVVRHNQPEAKRQDLRKLASTAYNWLSLYDLKWLNENSPPSVRAVASNGSNWIDWAERDATWSNAILDAAHRLINSPSRPKQITTAVLGREIGELSKIRNGLDKLPLTAQVLAEVVETPEQIVIRRIQWVTERYRQENVYPSRNQLERRAGVYPKVKQSIQVQEAIAKALSILISMRTETSSTS